MPRRVPEPPPPLSPELRPRAFAAAELLLDVLYVARGWLKSDMDTLLIYLCVSEATMRPLVLGPHMTPEVMVEALPDEALRGSISRLLIAERTGLSRETVRRKANALLKDGRLVEDEQGRLRTTRNLVDPSMVKTVNDIHATVQRYDARVRELGGAGISR